ncbi:hypothetical protein ACTHOQ_14800 [Solibacillus silvestris]|uniref:hypothetical protein n=1 Tax=Solibacillus silvestris TaxID=76853 RepID=UPI003F7FF9E0
MILSQIKPKTNFANIIDHLSLSIHQFDLDRCDERTFYITIEVKYMDDSTICDLIFLIDRDELFGAISLNNLYENVQRFFMQHFRYQLLYTDEMQIAKIITTHPQFSQRIRIYSQKYPKHTIRL